MTMTMSWEQFYLICFGVGLVLSVVFLLTGALHIHLPGKLAVHHPGTHSAAPKVKVHGASPANSGAVSLSSNGAAAHGMTHVSPFNLFSIMAFLAWFGGTGFLLTHYYSFFAWTAFGLASLSGAIAASIVFYFLTKVMLGHERVMSDEEGEMVGVIGRVTSTIREDGVGEIVFSQSGKRRSAGARSESGAAMARGTEVVVTRYERGVAYVREWREFAGELQEDDSANRARGEP